MLIETCLNNNLIVGGTIFPHKNIHKVTWLSPDSVTENQIDHIAISSKWRGSLLDVRNRRGADCASDHHLLTGTIRLKVAAIKKGTSTQRRFDVEKLQDVNVRDNYTDALESSLAAMENDQTLNNWDTVKECFLKAAKAHIGYKTSNRKQWISDLTWNTIKQRKELKDRLNTAKTRDAKAKIRAEYYALDKRVKKHARDDKRRWFNNLAKDAESSATQHNMKNLYSITKKLTSKNSLSSKPLRKQNGEIATSKAEQMETWVMHYSSLIA